MGGRVIGCVPNSNVIGAKIREFHAAYTEDELRKSKKTAEFGNDIYNVRFSENTPVDGKFRRPFGDKYSFHLAEAVVAPEYVVPWEIFCGIAREYSLELEYCKSFDEVWAEEKDDEFLGQLNVEMGVRDKDDGRFLVSPAEMEAGRFYHAFCFVKS